MFSTLPRPTGMLYVRPMVQRLRQLLVLLIAFAFIWAGLGVFTLDLVRRTRSPATS